MAKRYGKARKSKTCLRPRSGVYGHSIRGPIDDFLGALEIATERCVDCLDSIIDMPIYLGLGHNRPICVDCFSKRCNNDSRYRLVYAH